MNPTPPEKKDKLELDESWKTDWFAIKKYLIEVFHDDTGLTPELLWTTNMPIRSGVNGIEKEITPDFLPPKPGEKSRYWLYEAFFNEWLYAEQSRILSAKLSQFQLEIQKYDNFISLTAEKKTSILGKQTTDNSDRERAALQLEMLEKERGGLLGDSREDLSEQTDKDVWDGYEEKMRPYKQIIAGIDASSIKSSHYDMEDRDNIVADWYEKPEDLGQTLLIKTVNLDEVITAAKYKRNLMSVTKLDPLQSQITVTNAAKDYWQSKANDLRNAQKNKK